LGTTQPFGCAVPVSAAVFRGVREKAGTGAFYSARPWKPAQDSLLPSVLLLLYFSEFPVKIAKQAVIHNG